MKKVIVRLVILVSLAAIGLVVYSSLHKKRERPLKARTIDEMLALPEEQIEVGLGALLIGKEYDPNLDVRKYLKELDNMADELRRRIGKEKDSRKVIAAMNHYIFTERGYTALKPGEKMPGGRFLNTLMDRKIACHRLYLALGERLGLPLSAVAVPNHIFVRYVSGDTWINIEAEKDGATPSDTEYLSQYRIPNTPAARSFYLRNLAKREYLACLLLSLGVEYVNREMPKEALTTYRRALAIIPNCAEAWNNLAPAYGKLGRVDESIEALRTALRIDPDYSVAWYNLALASYDKADYGYAWSCIHRCEQLGHKPNPEVLRLLSAKMRDPGA